MYSQEEINSAVAAGAISEDAANGLRTHVAKLRAMPIANEEQFRLITSFNDIFVTIGVIIMLIAVGSIGGAVIGGIEPDNVWQLALMGALPSALVAATAWGLAEIFTRKRRMALPSIILLLAFVGASFALVLSVLVLPFGLIFGPGSFAAAEAAGWEPDETLGAIVVAAMLTLTGAATTWLTWQHWKRFMVPVTVAAGTTAVVGTFVAIVQITSAIITDGNSFPALMPVLFLAGIGVFAFAMWWDMSDRSRTTRRSDVAFWLHMLSAPIIAHTVFSSIGLTGSGVTGVGGAVAVLLVYIIFGVVALIIDRRALLVSALVYVLFALTFLFSRFGAVELNFALTAFVIGSALLSLSVFWTPIRQKLVAMLPDEMQGRLPSIAST
ncbi:hypothetical protein [Parerythrobacter jejuensis]|uniref:Membrane protein DUF2157 n=1 Tax=Parerythrobacter jejuensis TaxID=795812 RepID=A0A845AU90_9SPHN|nr:hypothetical protein [Parerythrobacter jejuensis]MXP32877.1 hypothetical protein [Parerythrobacter jejuensis]